jgi:hypothetical protein
MPSHRLCQHHALEPPETPETPEALLLALRQTFAWCRALLHQGRHDRRSVGPGHVLHHLPVLEPPASEPVPEPPASEPVPEPPASEPVLEPPASEPVLEPVLEPPASEPVPEPPASEPVPELLV